MTTPKCGYNCIDGFTSPMNLIDWHETMKTICFILIISIGIMYFIKWHYEYKKYEKGEKNK